MEGFRYEEDVDILWCKRNEMKTSVDVELINDLARIMTKHTAVLSAYVFGSLALGCRRRDSDVDIAVRVDERLTAETAFDLRLELIDELEEYFGCRVDVVILNVASLTLIHQVMKSGHRVYAMNPDAETAFRLQKQKEYFDFRYYLEGDLEDLRAFFTE